MQIPQLSEISPRTRKIAGAVAGLFVLVFAWRSEPVQMVLQPAKYWSGKVVLQEIEVDQVRQKLTECLTAQQKLRTARAPSQPQPQGGTAPAAGASASLQALEAMCASLDDELQQAIKNLLEIKKKRQQTRS